ncbi:sigma-54 dependent transcriptional regulator [Sporomusa sp.]|uniref:sigma-54-dependent transcriptional regulator n=1 Tax=Sporomusa sp. TaxID=2078658 RepID=UPI002CB26308|nr:sigma-54 dependent transcriptional regulator [Sporomusa sp.]HWR05940.1 sigma-54 dependent transcriptional regulator [Sporomusa sp.]
MKILLVDDDADNRISVGNFLYKLGYQVTECCNGEEALSTYSAGSFPMILTDIRMPKMSGVDLLKQVKSSPGAAYTDVVLFTGHGTMESAIDALRMGAFDYLLKPINLQELVIVTEKVAEHQGLLRENHRLTDYFEQEVRAETLETANEICRLRKLAAKAEGIGEIGIFSEAMQDIYRQATQYHQDRSIPVLIQGETGTGKELIAKRIHYADFAVAAPFIDINCAALTPMLFESELFGYEAGSFTGGLVRGQKGKLDIAAGGTLFLDEISEMPPEIQAKLLRVLQEKEFYRVGGLKKIKSDVRVICATNSSLNKAVEDGRFRRDLYYRLNVGQIFLPPLRHQPECIIPLAEMFLHHFSTQKEKKFVSISNEAARRLLRHSWPGNVRELKNAIEWSVFMFNHPELQADHLNIASDCSYPVQPQQQPVMLALDAPLALPAAPFSLNAYVDKIICAALKMHGGNKSATATYLGLSRRSLSYRAGKISEIVPR